MSIYNMKSYIEFAACDDKRKNSRNLPLFLCVCAIPF